MTVPLAHGGHWTSSLVYLVPVLAICLALLWQGWRDRRAGDVPDVEPQPTLDDILDGKNQK